MSALEIQETYVDMEKGHRYGETEWYQPYTDDLGRLYREFRSEYGRCTSKVYVDTATGVKPVGWVFVKRVEYDDAHRITRGPKTYLREVWVTYRHITEAN